MTLHDRATLQLGLGQLTHAAGGVRRTSSPGQSYPNSREIQMETPGYCRYHRHQ